MPEFLARCSASLLADHGATVSADRLQRMMDECLDVPVDAEVAALVADLKAAGYRTGLLTNMWAERRAWLHGIFDEGVIDVVCDSSAVGISKPDPGIYHRVADLLGLPATAIAFVDDFPENVAAARNVGMTGFLFETAPGLRRDLAQAGFRVSAPHSGTSLDRRSH
jgi:HAD superfamily hydrolase (TIGR01509 family)